MKLEVGKHYLAANGDVIEIVKFNYMNEAFEDERGREWFDNGSYLENIETKRDLIAEIPKELHWWLINQIKSYHTSALKRNFINSKFKEQENEYNC